MSVGRRAGRAVDARSRGGRRAASGGRRSLEYGGRPRGERSVDCRGLGGVSTCSQLSAVGRCL
ncbi:hypothetical protein [Pyrobaculum ferrireducens]|uniref:hypothetical protein n=1 Tax=Pyrobaculum ferrireducens TaxID=1104324 RepID=UPI0011E4E67B|nr:hypothetical protein [Pyrobaculum ferrireducens]